MSLTKVSYSMIQGATVNAFDYGFSTNASAANNAAAIMAAIAALPNGGIVWLPAGTYDVDADVISITTGNITLQGDGSASAYQQTNAGTRLYFSSGTIGFDIESLSNSDGITIKDVFIFGNSHLSTGIQFVGMGFISGVQVSSCTAHGLKIINPTNMLQVESCSFSYNTTGYGVYVSGTAGISYTTAMSFNKLIVRQNLEGFVIEGGMQVTVKNSVIESNLNYGIHFYATNQCQDWLFENCWLENNWDGTTSGNTYQVLLDGTPSYSPQFCRFVKCRFSAVGAGQKYVWIKKALYIEFDKCESYGSALSDSWVFDTAAAYCKVDGWESGYGIPTAAQISTGNRSFKRYIQTNGFSGERTEAAYLANAFQIAPIPNAGLGGLYTTFGYGSSTISGTTVKITVNIPAGAMILACQLRVDAALAAGDTWDAKYDGGTTVIFAQNQPVTKNTKVNVPWGLKNNAGTLSVLTFDTNSITASTDVYITKSGGGAFTGSGGVISAWVYYTAFETIPSV